MVNIELSDIFKLRKELGKIAFSDVVYASCGYKVIPIEPLNEEDKKLLSNLDFAINNFLRISKKTDARIWGNRINDIGKKIEVTIEEEIRKTPLEITKLGRSGYPDFEIKQGERTTYLELKTTSNVRKKKTNYRMFYYSSGSKIKSDARHLLLQIQMEEERSKYWKVAEWQIRDFSDLKVGLKTEFNANFQDFSETQLLKSGE